MKENLYNTIHEWTSAKRFEDLTIVSLSNSLSLPKNTITFLLNITRHKIYNAINNTIICNICVHTHIHQLCKYKVANFDKCL